MTGTASQTDVETDSHAREITGRTTAFVFSGGGSRAALEVGALQALLEAGVEPDMYVGVSAGALNAVYLAGRGWGAAQLDELALLWENTRKDDVFPGGRLAMLWRTLRGKASLFPNERFTHFLRRSLPSGVERFRDLGDGRAYVVASRLDSGQAHVFGDDLDDVLIDALMATSALPPLFAPWKVNGSWFYDGAAATMLPVEAAFDRGAEVVWGIHVVTEMNAMIAPQDVFSNVSRAVHASFNRKAVELRQRIEGSGGRHLTLGGYEHLSPWDFDHGAELIRSGYKQTRRQLGIEETDRLAQSPA